MSNGETGQVTQAGSTDVAANTLNQAEAKEQANMREGAGGIKVPLDYHFMVEQGRHKVTAVVEQGLNYNFHVVCEGCDWEGRYLTKDTAEEEARDHLVRKFPSRG